MIHTGPDWWVVVAVLSWAGLLLVVTVVWVRSQW
jgi:hypothetical protein